MTVIKKYFVVLSLGIKKVAYSVRRKSTHTVHIFHIENLVGQIF